MSEQGDSNISFGSLSTPDFLRPTYANYVNVGHTPYDFRLSFALVKAPTPGPELEAVQSEGALHPEVVADIVIPVNVVQGLIAALRQSLEAYLNSYGMPGLGDGGEQS